MLITPAVRAAILVFGAIVMFILAQRGGDNARALYGVGTVFLVLGVLRFVRTFRRI